MGRASLRGAAKQAGVTVRLNGILLGGRLIRASRQGVFENGQRRFRHGFGVVACADVGMTGCCQIDPFPSCACRLPRHEYAHEKNACLRSSCFDLMMCNGVFEKGLLLGIRYTYGSRIDLKGLLFFFRSTRGILWFIVPGCSL